MKKKDTFDEQILLEILENAGRPLRFDDILRATGFSRRLKKDILLCLQDLASNGAAVRIPGGSWAVPSSLKSRRGRLAVQRSGAAFVIPEGDAPKSGSDIYIAPENIGDAWNGDLVDVMLLPGRGGHGRSAEGVVTAVAARGCTEITVRVLRDGTGEGTVLCRPVDPRLPFDILASLDAGHHPGEFELLLVEPGEKISDTGRRPVLAGRALQSLGRENDAFVQENLVKLNHSIPTEFPDNVLAEADAAASRPDDPEEHPADLRSELLVTIDGEDARDFDDAVCAERLETGWRLLVAIADVSHYVRPRTALDREAFERGNSFYFPTSVEPMLPEVLCNGACSLVPGEDRRCMAADLRLDDSGEILEAKFTSGVMRSHARLTYTEVQAALDDPQGEAAALIGERAPGVPAMLAEAARLAEILIERRNRRGALDFDLPEAEFLVEGDRHGGEGRVTGIRNRTRLFSHRLIEAFMVRANEAVAEFLREHGAPFLYRAHPAPGPEKLEGLYKTLRATDLPLPHAAKSLRADWIPHVLDAARGTDGEAVVNRLVLRSMMQARYTPEEDGHFGLASPCYCHFTSPIRRYSDLVNHRALRYALGLDTGGPLPAGHKLLETADRCNEQERTATDAEREVERRMGCLLLQGRTGEMFGGVISGVMNFGFFVELDGMPVEGMVRIETLGRDYYVLDEDRQELRGEHTGRTFRLGQRVNVQLAGVHVGRLEIDLEYRDDDEGRRPYRRRSNDDSATSRREDDGGRGERRGRRSFADRKGFRPHGGNEMHGRREGSGPEEGSAGDDRRGFRGERRERPFRGEREGFGGRGRSFRSERRPGERDGLEDRRSGGRPFRGGFGQEDDGDRADRPHSFRPRRGDDGFAPRGFRRPRPDRGEGGEGGFREFHARRDFRAEEPGGERPFRRERPFRNEQQESGSEDARSFGGRSFDRGERGGFGGRSRSFRNERRPGERNNFEDRRSGGRPFRGGFGRGDDGDRADRPHSFRPHRRDDGFAPRGEKDFGGSRFGHDRRNGDAGEAEGRSFHDRFNRNDRFGRDGDRHGRRDDRGFRFGGKDGRENEGGDFFKIEVDERPVHRFGRPKK